MMRFGGDHARFFGAVYQGEAPWDIGTPQPALTQMFETFPLRSPVLDVGCGSGDLAIWIARHGHDAVGVDLVSAAIARARQKQGFLPLDIGRNLEFRVSDALRPALLGRRFASVVDSGFYHLFEQDDCARFAEELAHVLEPGGRYYLLAFAAELPAPDVPRAVTELELRAHFNARSGWRVLDVRAAEFVSRVGVVPAICACFERSRAWQPSTTRNVHAR